jgi:hypothetical protein
MRKLAASVCLLVMSSSAFAAGNSSTMNFRFDPLGLIIGMVGVNLDFVVAPEWTVGPQVGYWHLKISESGTFVNNDISLTAYTAGARANWFANGVFTDGLYVGPSARYYNVKATGSDSTGTVTGSASGLMAGCLVGYGWFWDSFNMMLGAGGNLALGNNDVEVKHSNGTEETKASGAAGLSLEWSLGWTF